MNRFRAIIVVVLALSAAACRSRRPTPGLEPELAACIPSNTLAAAGIDLDRLRASPLYAKLPPAAAALLRPLGSASAVLAAYDGAEAVVIARGAFREPPAGMTLLAKGLAASGSPEAIRAAAARRKSSVSGARWLLDRAAAVAGPSPIWAAVRGGATLPLTGDAANLNQLLRLVEYAAFGIRLDSELRFDAVAQGRDEESARRFEENVRAIFTLAAGPGKSPLADALQSAQVRREGLIVRVALSLRPEHLDSLLPWKQP